MAPDGSARLAREKYLSLTTTRRDGRAVATPVWFALDQGKVLVITDAQTGKVKRIRHTPRVTIAPCTARGNVTGEAMAATARLLPASEGPRVQRLFDSRYPIARPLWKLATRALRLARRNTMSSPVYVEITVG